MSAEELLNACARGDLDAAKLLATADIINSQDKEGHTPLLWASNGKDDLLKFLLTVPNVKLECRDNDGMTPLLTAVSMDGSMGCLQALVEVGCDVYAKDTCGMGWKGWSRGQTAKREYMEEIIKNPPKIAVKEVKEVKKTPAEKKAEAAGRLQPQQSKKIRATAESVVFGIDDADNIDEDGNLIDADHHATKSKACVVS